MTDGDYEPSHAFGKRPDIFCGEMIGFTGQRLMELEVEELTGVAHGERSADRINQRNALAAQQHPLCLPSDRLN